MADRRGRDVRRGRMGRLCKGGRVEGQEGWKDWKVGGRIEIEGEGGVVKSGGRGGVEREVADGARVGVGRVEGY